MRVSKIASCSVVILLITVLFAGAVPAAVQYDTMQFRYNAEHTGDYSSVAGSTPPNGQLKWSYTTGSYVYSSPAVANGVVYVGSDDNNLYALNTTTGAKLWSFTTGGSVYSSPAVANGVVYVGSWDFDGNVYALNATTGTKLWSYTTGGYVFSSPAVANGVVYVGSYDNNLYALNATTGTKLWSYTTGGYVGTSPAVANGVVYVGSGAFLEPAALYALNATTGAQVWNFTTSGGVSSSAAVANGVVYVGSEDNNVYALNATTGMKLWNYTTSTGPSSPAVANGVVYVGGLDGTVYALNASNGSKLWNYTTRNSVESSPAISNGTVYVGGYDGNVYALGNSTTSITAAASTTVVAVNKPFTINGTLSGSTTGIAGATIQLQKNVGGTWTNVTGKTNTTTSAGAYRISTSEPTTGTYQYRATYAGNTTYAGSNSTSLSVKVVSKASVLQDFATLRTAINRLPNSAFYPGTKTALLSLVSATELQVKFNLYSSAATTLQKAVLPRMDGCTKTGKPDSDDWVRTCAAQSQLNPQVQNLIPELQALQGS